MLAEVAWEARAGADARFLANLGVLFGTPGPASDLPRSLAAFDAAAPAWPEATEPDERARLLHNRANALAALGETPADLEEAVALYREALRLRPEATRRVARGVTQQNLGAALRRLAALADAAGFLADSEEAHLAAVALREAEALPEGLALSTFHLGLTREARVEAGDPAFVGGAVEAYEDAARRYEALGRTEEAGVARGRAFAILARCRTEF